MEKQRIGLLFFLAIVISLALASFVSCVLAETNKAKKKDVKLVNALCYMPESNAFGFGMAAIACLVVAHTVTNLVICTNFLSCFSCSSSNKPPATTADPPLPPSNSTVSASSSSLSSSAKSSRNTPTILAILLMLLS
ncbi:Protein MODIFYING WALL LIGNIN-2 [Linum grandiflorum]